MFVRSAMLASMLALPAAGCTSTNIQRVPAGHTSTHIQPAATEAAAPRSTPAWAQCDLRGTKQNETHGPAHMTWSAACWAQCAALHHTPPDAEDVQRLCAWLELCTFSATSARLVDSSERLVGTWLAALDRLGGPAQPFGPITQPAVPSTPVIVPPAPSSATALPPPRHCKRPYPQPAPAPDAHLPFTLWQHAADAHLPFSAAAACMLPVLLCPPAYIHAVAACGSHTGCGNTSAAAATANAPMHMHQALQAVIGAFAGSAMRQAAEGAVEGSAPVASAPGVSASAVPAPVESASIAAAPVPPPQAGAARAMELPALWQSSDPAWAEGQHRGCLPSAHAAVPGMQAQGRAASTRTHACPQVQGRVSSTSTHACHACLQALSSALALGHVSGGSRHVAPAVGGPDALSGPTFCGPGWLEPASKRHRADTDTHGTPGSPGTHSEATSAVEVTAAVQQPEAVVQGCQEGIGPCSMAAATEAGCHNKAHLQQGRKVQQGSEAHQSDVTQGPEVRLQCSGSACTRGHGCEGVRAQSGRPPPHPCSSLTSSTSAASTSGGSWHPAMASESHTLPSPSQVRMTHQV
jgi:hypothetical protein